MRSAGWMAATIVLGGCTSGIGRPVSEVTARTDADGVQRVRVEAHSFYFEPNRIIVHAGKPVELTVKNGGVLIPHNFSCIAEQAGVDVHQDVGMFRGQKAARFTPGTPGEYPFFCSKDGHSKKGMKGMLVVVP